MRRQERAHLAKARGIQKRLRSTFRSVLTAQKLGYDTDLKRLTAELSELSTPQNQQSARRYVRTVIPAAQAHFVQGELDIALDLFMRVVPVCRQFNLLHHELRATALLVSILRRKQRLVEARTFVEKAIETARAAERNSYQKRFQEELAVINALIIHSEAVSTMGGEVFFTEDKEQGLFTEQEYRIRRMDPAEAVGARRARMRRTVFDDASTFSMGDPRRAGGRRKSVFVSTLLKKDFGGWQRNPSE